MALRGCGWGKRLQGTGEDIREEELELIDERCRASSPMFRSSAAIINVGLKVEYLIKVAYG